MDGGSGLGERREAVAAACRALTGLGEVLWAAGSGELEAVMERALLLHREGDTVGPDEVDAAMAAWPARA